VVAVVAAIVLAVTATGLGLHLSSTQHRLTAAQERDSAISAIVGARGAIMMTAKVSNGGTATVVMSHRADALVFIANGLPRLPSSQAYEVWLMGPAGTATAAGMLAPGRPGMSGPTVVRRIATGDRLGLTIEPASGAPRPTSPPIVLMALTR
jgi:anti-sigma-K factor RskA